MSSGLVSSNTPQNQSYRILFVCSDLEDVTLANSFGNNGDILYLGKDLPDDRSPLSDILYLSKYDEIWIPDLNVQWTEGGRLSEGEIGALTEYVQSGGVLVIGLNTYTQSWSRKLDALLGVRVLRLESPIEDGEDLDIVFNERVYPYNDTYQAVIIRPEGAKVIARYRNGNPAITLNSYGSGVAVLMTFNPVKAYVEGNPSFVDLYREVSSEALKERKNPPTISNTKKTLILLKRVILHPITLGLLVFILLEILAYLGLMPLGLTVFFAAPFIPFWGIIKRRKRCTSVLEIISMMRGVTLSELSNEMGEKVRRLKFCIAILKLKRKISILDISRLGGRDYLITLHGLESEGVAAWAVEMYPRLMERIALHPGVTILDLARSSNMPPYEVLQLLREMSRYGVVEIRKMPFDYEVYSTRALLRWFEV
ncbi:hypothetical protein A3L08_08315 [Thermococcus pacificus]|uniref:Beta-galactosidase trimerisation domain-containing protein n=2 Tax=Thermococcus pacificus TaxID=71998 RepID=A0A218PA91_9EURY|nr:hypothetical protein A3L08_08315 [Thermococcus pacificus]